MSNSGVIGKSLIRHPYAPAILYAVLVFTFLSATWMAIAGISERRESLAETTDLLAQLDRRVRPQFGNAGAPEGVVMTGSPFLEGTSVTVASATLLQRVASAVTRAGGNILSTQVELQGSRSKDGFVSVIVSCEIDQPSLQQLLYDLEAGMPFLFVDQLAVQAPTGGSNASEKKLQLLITASGQWQGAK